MRFVAIFGLFYGKDGQRIGLKALGNYSDQFWSNKTPILLCEGPKPNISMTSGFFTPWSPVLMASIIIKYFKKH